ncbi:respiratory nitrate reductase subunit gamma [Paenibacillus physcomitrellae]|uniref:Nitrate reductase subunit gamma n=1 Tax=Paenibacillus physcomitrellae TaxID=1619311 RepID=A0ABQ1FVF4_9BACL|nr:respiratory nitrate reductase subunit gamma [Paenibacillus physcomitrellae]GGA30257.1 nitrate reductase subunit gamma [Paenibacillus physcomitrellae]
MTMLNQFLWVIYPYLCLAIFVVGHIFRYRTDQFNWTAKSSEFIEKKRLMAGSLLFHLGVIPVFFGHVSGLGIPKSWMRAFGVDDHIYHIGAVYIGGIFGAMTLIGMLILTARRFTMKNVRRLSSASDLAVNALLLIIVCMGMFATLVTNAVRPEFDYRETISVWFRGLFMLRPDASLMTDVPLSFKLHALLGFGILAFWPFSRLVHVWSVPLNYMGRSYILYRKNKTTRREG